ncbi:trans-sialidase, putative, partial [Trypanosoma cruzi marinkellei]
NFSGTTWVDEYLGVNATVKGGAAGATGRPDGVTFQGAWAEWPVGAQGENQLYYFANYNFTLVATVSIDGVPEGDNIPVIGVKMNGAEKTAFFGLSYNKEKKWLLLCGGGQTKGQSSNWKPGTERHVVILIRNGNQTSAYVDGKTVGGNEQCALGNTYSEGISHFYIGGNGGSAGRQEGVPVTVKNVLLYNRPLSSEDITALTTKLSIPKVAVPQTVAGDTPPKAIGPDTQETVSQSSPAGQQPSEHS